MIEDRASVITVGGEEYTLLLTTKATKQVAARYGGLENLGDKLIKSENFELAINEIVWLITESLQKSTNRNIISEDDAKNVAVG